MKSLSQELRVLYVYRRDGAPIIRDIDQDIVAALELQCTLKTLDLSPAVVLTQAGQFEELGRWQQGVIAQVREFAPDFAMGYNTTGIMPAGNNHVLALLGIPYAAVFFDNPFYFGELFDHCPDRDGIHIFGIDPPFLSALGAYGFHHTHYLPIGTGLQSGRAEGGTAGVLFVGMIKQGRSQGEFEANYSGAELAFIRYADVALRLGESDSQEALWGRFCHSHPDYAMLREDERSWQRLWFAVDIHYTTQRRIQVVRSLADFGIAVHGNDTWAEALTGTAVEFCGGVQYREGVADSYAGAKITVNCSPLNLQNAVQQRCLDVGAAGGFVLTEYRPVLEKHFVIGEEIAVYHSFTDLRTKVAYYLAHEEERQAIAARLHQRVTAEHRWTHRVTDLLRVMACALR